MNQKLMVLVASFFCGELALADVYRDREAIEKMAGCFEVTFAYRSPDRFVIDCI